MACRTQMTKPYDQARDQVRRSVGTRCSRARQTRLKSCTASRAVAAFTGGNKGTQHYCTDELVALGGAQMDKRSGDKQDGGGPAPMGLVSSAKKGGAVASRVVMIDP
jgi:hypothetical protein